MAVDWGSIYSINKGGAQVIQGNPGLQDLKEQYAKQQQERAQEDAQFAAGLAKLNFKGARDADFPEMNKQYADILKTHAQLRSTNNLAQRQALQQQLQQKQQGLMYDINQSTNHNQHEQKLADLRLNPNANLSDDYYKTVTDIQKIPSIGGDNYNKYQSALQQGTQNLFDKPVDFGKVGDDIFKRITSESKESGATVKDPKTGLYYKPTLSTTSADKGDYLKGWTQAVKGNTALGKKLMSQYGTNDISDAVQKHVESTWPTYEKKTGTDVMNGGEFQSEGQRKQKTPTFIEQQYFNKYGKWPEPNQASNSPTYVQDLSKRIATPQTFDSATEELNTMAANNPAFEHGIGAHKNPDGTSDIVIPAKYKFDKTAQAKYDAMVGKEDENGNIIKPNPKAGRLKIADARTIHLDPRNPTQHDQNVGFIYNELDPHNVSSKTLTTGGKGHVPSTTTTKPAIKPSKQAKNYGL